MPKCTLYESLCNVDKNGCYLNKVLCNIFVVSFIYRTLSLHSEEIIS